MSAVLRQAWLWERHRDLPLIAALLLGSGCLSFFSPQGGLVAAWVAVMLAAARAPRLLSGPLLLFSHAGALIFASRSFDGLSSDFRNYFGVFSEFCSAGGSPVEALRTFGLEVGVPAAYGLLSTAGGCGLSIAGLAYLQALVVSFATLLIMTRYAVAATGTRERPYAIGGLCLMYSFFFATQVSRQSASSIFLLAALFVARTGTGVALNLMLATLLHLTAPVIFAIAWVLRMTSNKGLVALAAAAACVALYSGPLLAFAIANLDAFEPLAKLAYYAGELEDGAFSDTQSLVYLLVPGLAFALVPRLRRLPDAARDARLLLGFALVGLLLLPLPLATTRLTLAFGLLVQGYFIFKALASLSRPIAAVGLLLLLALRIGLIGGSGGEEHALWSSYARASWLPGYFVSSF